MLQSAPTASVEQIIAEGERRHKRRVWKVVFIVALLVFLVSVGSLGVIGFSYFQGQQKYDEAASLANLDLAEAGASGDVSRLKVDWDALRKANPDTVAWLYIPGTAINYPVVQGKDNDYYLNYDFDGEAGWLANYGAIFMDYRNKRNWSDASYFIFGHHMNDGSMFADIAGLEDQARFDECRTVYLLSPEGNFKLRTYSLVHCAPDDPLVVQNFKSAKERTAYVQDKMDRSLVAADDAPDASKITKTFGFATCDSGSWGRDVLFAYVEETSVDGLEGTIGIAKNKEGVQGFVENVKES